MNGNNQQYDDIEIPEAELDWYTPECDVQTNISHYQLRVYSSLGMWCWYIWDYGAKHSVAQFNEPVDLRVDAVKAAEAWLKEHTSIFAERTDAPPEAAESEAEWLIQ